MVTVFFGSDGSHDSPNAWDVTFDLVAAALAAIGEDVYGEDWAEADEGCSREGLTPERAEQIVAALTVLPGVCVWRD